MSLSDLVGRGVALAAGTALLVDGLAPLRTENVNVAPHPSHVREWQEKLAADGKHRDVTLYLVGGEVPYCKLDPSTFARLRDGDRVEVKSTRIWGRCVRVARDGEVVHRVRYHWLFHVLAAGFLLALALRRRASDDDHAEVD